jgi:hypothetical protein
VDDRAVVVRDELQQRLAGAAVVLGDAAVVDDVEEVLVLGDGLVGVERVVGPDELGGVGGRDRLRGFRGRMVAGWAAAGWIETRTRPRAATPAARRVASFIRSSPFRR